MTKDPDFDILIVGSGPSGVQAGASAVQSGFKVGLVDIGYTDEKYAPLIPAKSFSEIRKGDPNQGAYFLGDDPAQAFQSQAKAGAHLTPPRQHMIRNMEKCFPIESDSFVPLQSTACGGLGVSWGANAFTLEDFELRRIGLPVVEMKKFYVEAAAAVGVSGSKDDDLAPLIADGISVQPPLKLDTNAKKILERYQSRRDRFLTDGFYLGQSLLAVLSQSLGERKPNPYWDMDFWSDLSQSVYRPVFTLRELKNHSGFSYLNGRLALRFEEEAAQGEVRLLCKNISSGSFETITARRLILAAGAINSGKLAYASLGAYDKPMPILTNPNHWVAAIHLPMLGREAEDARYSLAQLTALLRVPEDPEDYVLGQFYSYRSLLYSRLLPNLPLPPKLGLLFLRFLITSFMAINLHFSDTPTPRKWLKVVRRGGEDDILQAHYERTEAEEAALRRNERRFVRKLLALKLIPLGINRPAHGASIHYAGTLPFHHEDKPFTCEPNGRLRGTRAVFVADGAPWNFMPAKGLTLSLMAGARRVASHVVRGLG